MPSDPEQFERVVLVRLAALERRNARLFWMLVALVLAFAWRELAFRPVVRGSRFELVDPAGELRGLWQTQGDRPGLILRDDGGWRAELSASRDGARLRLFGTSTEPLLQAESAEGRARLSLTPTDGPATILPPLAPQN